MHGLAAATGFQANTCARRGVPKMHELQAALRLNTLYFLVIHIPCTKNKRIHEIASRWR